MQTDSSADLIVHGDFDVPDGATSDSPSTDAADLGGESPCFAHLLDEPVD